jgi:hypothetical protein
MRTLTLALAALGLSATSAFAQLGTATMSGTVAAHSGAVIQGATVRAVNQASGFERNGVSNNVGEFSLPGLVPGTYDLTTQSQGFKTWQSKSLYSRWTGTRTSTSVSRSARSPRPSP